MWNPRLMPWPMFMRIMKTSCPRLKRKKEVTQTVLDIKDFPKGGDAGKFLYPQAKRALIIHMRVHGVCTSTLQKSRMPQIRGVKGEAVVIYCELLTTKEMGYPRLSHGVNNTVKKNFFLDITGSRIQYIGNK